MDGRETQDYLSTLEWLASLDETRVKPGLERIRQLVARLGHPQQLHAVIVGGTNGKGSCCWLLEDALCRAGIRVGCATSPHLHSVRERLRLDGELVGQAEFAALAGEVQQTCREMAEHPTYFEVLTAMTLLWFARCRVEVAVLEVGLGGELDAMNIVDAKVAVLTTLALEHTDWLGSDLGAIARTKAGIVRPASRTERLETAASPGGERVPRPHPGAALAIAREPDAPLRRPQRPDRRPGRAGALLRAIHA